MAREPTFVALLATGLRHPICWVRVVEGNAATSSCCLLPRHHHGQWSPNWNPVAYAHRSSTPRSKVCLCSLSVPPYHEIRTSTLNTRTLVVLVPGTRSKHQILTIGIRAGSCLIPNPSGILIDPRVKNGWISAPRARIQEQRRTRARGSDSRKRTIKGKGNGLKP